MDSPLYVLSLRTFGDRNNTKMVSKIVTSAGQLLNPEIAQGHLRELVEGLDLLVGPEHHPE